MIVFILFDKDNIQSYISEAEYRSILDDDAGFDIVKAEARGN